MKVCITTFYHMSHPGAVLQAYALFQVLATLRHNPELVNYHRERLCKSRTRKEELIRFITRAYRRDAAFAAFRAQRLRETTSYLNYNALVTSPPKGEAYVCGSDQIWNPSLLGGEFDPAYFLAYGGTNVIRVSYAASFGGYTPNRTQCDQISNYLSRFEHLSVREPSGQLMLRQILGRDVQLTLDPTLLIGDYRDLLRVCPNTGGYVLLYSLQNSAEINRAAKMTAAYFNKPLRTFGGPFLPWKVTGSRIKTESPIEWLSQINGAVAVVTNSFHGLVFGLLFRKRVIVVPLCGAKIRRNERLFHICELLGVSESVIPRVIDRSSLSREINWDSLDKRLEEGRNSSLAYLRAAIPSS